jgi:hypothetical protein
MKSWLLAPGKINRFPLTTFSLVLESRKIAGGKATEILFAVILLDEEESFKRIAF